MNTNKQIKSAIQKRMVTDLNGKAEVQTPAGNIDILTDDELIEIRHISKWTYAIGHVQVYNIYCKRNMRIHLFYTHDTDLNILAIIKADCEAFNIRLTTEKYKIY